MMLRMCLYNRVRRTSWVLKAIFPSATWRWPCTKEGSFCVWSRAGYFHFISWELTIKWSLWFSKQRKISVGVRFKDSVKMSICYQYWNCCICFVWECCQYQMLCSVEYGTKGEKHNVKDVDWSGRGLIWGLMFSVPKYYNIWIQQASR